MSKLNKEASSTFCSSSKPELYNAFAKDLDDIGSDLRAELESHLDADKGGDLLDEKFFEKIMIKFDCRLNKLCEQFAEKADKISDSTALGELLDVGSRAQDSLSFKHLIMKALLPYIILTDPAPVPFPFSLVGTLIFGTFGLLKGKREKREKIVEMTMEGFNNNVRPKCLEWAEKLLGN